MKWIVAIFVFGLVIALTHAPQVFAAPGAIFTVTQTADLEDANLADNRCDTNAASAGDQCSLRAAIQQANATPGTDTIKFVSTAAHTLTRNGNDNTANRGDLDISDPIIIEGKSPATTIDGNGLDRVFQVLRENSATFKNLVIRGGHLTTNSAVAAGVQGGAGALSFDNVTLTDNIVDHLAPAGFSGPCCAGAGDISCNCLVTFANGVSTSGGFTDGIVANRVDIRDSEIKNHGQFGVVLKGPGSSTVLRTEFRNNMGGISNVGGTLLVQETEISGGTGGRWLFEVLYAGHGISNIGPNAFTTVVNSTISGNQTATGGGGIFNSGTVELFNVTIANNSTVERCDNAFICTHGNGGGIFNTGTLELTSTIVANNTDNTSGGVIPDCSGLLFSNGFNLIGNDTGCTLNGTLIGNKLNANPLLAALANNGGPTGTHGLQAGSPAIDAGHVEGCSDQVGGPPLPTDQRGQGFPRATDGDGINGPRCDIGAFEVGAVGIGALSPKKGNSNPGEQVVFDLAWDSPTRWRDLTTLDLRFKRKKETLLWLRFTEGLPTSTISLLDANGNVVDSGNVGEARKLKNKFGSVDLAQSGFTASGPDDPHVVVHFAVTFKGNARGTSKIQMLATDDFLNEQGPEPAGKWKVE